MIEVENFSFFSIGLGSSSMSTSTATLLLVVSVFLIVLNGIYVAFEFALVAAKHSDFEVADDVGSDLNSATNSSYTGSGRIDRLARLSLADVTLQLSGAQLGITMASLALGRIGEPALESFLDRAFSESSWTDVPSGLSVVLALFLFSALHLIFGEVVPKNIALSAPSKTLRFLVVPYRFYLFLFRPVVVSLNWLATKGARAVGVEPRDDLLAVHTAPELSAIVARSSEGGAIEEDDAKIIQGALEFAQKSVGEIATPLDELAVSPLGASAVQLERIVALTGQNRIPVVEPSSKVPIGYIHARDLLEVEPHNRAAPVPAATIRKMAVVRPDRPLIEVLRLLRRVKRQLAVVHNGDGQVGVVSVDEVVRALVQPPSELTVEA